MQLLCHGLLVGILVSFAATAALGADGDASSQGVQWLRSAEQAAELSDKTGKPILIYVRSETCHYCDLMQKDVWEDPRTAALIAREFIPLKLTREENKEGVAAMKVKGYPSTLIFSAQRSFIGRIDGYVNAQQFAQTANNLRAAAIEKDQAVAR